MHGTSGAASVQPETISSTPAATHGRGETTKMNGKKNGKRRPARIGREALAPCTGFSRTHLRNALCACRAGATKSTRRGRRAGFGATRQPRPAAAVGATALAPHAPEQRPGGAATAARRERDARPLGSAHRHRHRPPAVAVGPRERHAEPGRWRTRRSGRRPGRGGRRLALRREDVAGLQRGRVQRHSRRCDGDRVVKVQQVGTGAVGCRRTLGRGRACRA